MVFEWNIGNVCSLILMTPLLKLKHFGSAAAKAKIKKHVSFLKAGENLCWPKITMCRSVTRAFDKFLCQINYGISDPKSSYGL